MKHLTTRDKAIADAHVAIREAVDKRNAAATARAFKALKDAESSAPTLFCFGCGKEFLQGTELIVCCVGMVRKRTGEDGQVVTEWLFEGDASNTRNLAICEDCDNGIDEYIRMR